MIDRDQNANKVKHLMILCLSFLVGVALASSCKGMNAYAPCYCVATEAESLDANCGGISVLSGDFLGLFLFVSTTTAFMSRSLFVSLFFLSPSTGAGSPGPRFVRVHWVD